MSNDSHARRLLSIEKNSVQRLISCGVWQGIIFNKSLINIVTLEFTQRKFRSLEAFNLKSLKKIC